MASTQAFHPGHDAESVRRTFERLQSQRALSRIWNQDASLWSPDAAAQAAIRQRLGWLRIPQRMTRESDELQRVARAIRNDGITRVLLLGMGGSGLFAEVCRQIFGVAPGCPELTVLDTTDPAAVLTQQHQAALRQQLVIVSSKSGSTIEIASLSAYFYEALKAVSDQPGAHCLAITDAGTLLERQAAALNYRRTFLHGPESGADVGGRFSALTYFGLVPAALLGVDTSKLLARAIEMFERCGAAVPIEENPAAQLGAVLGGLAAAGKHKMTLLCAPALASFGTWAEQLIAESTGKHGQGIVPIFGEPIRQPAADAAERVFIELQMSSQPDPNLARQVDALIAAGYPVMRIRWQDAYDLGAEVAKWSLATAVIGAVLGVNPFDEPNVTESKDRTKALLSRHAQTGQLPAEAPLWEEGPLSVCGASVASVPRAMDAQLKAFLGQQRSGDCVTVLSFLPRLPGPDEALTRLRARLAERLRSATMLEHGPRYLHSTGQLYKGGVDAGLFLLLTADDPEDLPIPGEAFSFGLLKRAQALGDFEAMRERGRRILRIHLSGDLDRAVRRLLEAFDFGETPSAGL